MELIHMASSAILNGRASHYNGFNIKWALGICIALEVDCILGNGSINIWTGFVIARREKLD
jgi:hypothetical protein